MKLGPINALITRTLLETMLRKRAYAKADFQRMAAATPFGGAEVGEASMGLDVWLRKAERRSLSSVPPRAAAELKRAPAIETSRGQRS